jgi:NADH-quinone oxidoreductase subunit N
MFLSLAGIPLTAGFIAKFYVIAAGASSARWTLVLVLAITSGIGLYYYLRVVVTLYSQRERLTPPEPALGAVPRFLLAVLTSLLLWFGVFPGALLALIRDVVVS